MRRITLILILWLLPASTMAAPALSNLKDMRSAMLERLGQIDNRRFPDSVTTEYINAGLQRVCTDVGAFRGIDTITTDDNVAMYSINDDAIEGWVIEILAYNEGYTTNSWWGLQWSRISSWFDSENDRERNYHGYVHAGQITIYPPPDDSGGSLYIYYRGEHPTITADADTIYSKISHGDRNAAVEYACYLAARDAQMPNRQEYLAEYKWHVQSRQIEMQSFVGPKPEEVRP